MPAQRHPAVFALYIVVGLVTIAIVKVVINYAIHGA